METTATPTIDNKDLNSEYKTDLRKLALLYSQHDKYYDRCDDYTVWCKGKRSADLLYQCYSKLLQKYPDSEQELMKTAGYRPAP